ncbi:MAG: hypothetical protein ACU83N_11745 [Gammaproteobacteria bacterium]
MLNKRLLLIAALVGPAPVIAEGPDPTPGPSQPVTILGPLPLPVQVDAFPATQDVNVVSPNPLPVSVGNLPAVQDVNIVNDPLTVEIGASNEVRVVSEQGYMRTLHASSGFPDQSLVIPFDSILVGVLVATTGKTELGTCVTKLAYKSSDDRPDGANSNEILTVDSPSSDQVSAHSIYVSVPDLFIAAGVNVEASVNTGGPIATNTCGSTLTLYLRNQQS